MGQILDTVQEWLVSDDWNFERKDEANLIKCGIRGKNANFIMFCREREREQRLLVYIESPNNVPEDKRIAVAEFLTRANYGLQIGNFEMDMRDGEVRYKASIDIEGGRLTPKMVRNMVAVSALTMDRYFPGLMTICFAGGSPGEAIQEIEG